MTPRNRIQLDKAQARIDKTLEAKLQADNDEDLNRCFDGIPYDAIDDDMQSCLEPTPLIKGYETHDSTQRSAK